MLTVIEKLKIPVLTAWNAHDIVENSNPYFCGRPGTLGTRDGNFITQGADFILVLGSRLNVRQVGYNFEEFGENAFVVMVDIDDSELNKSTLNINLKIQSDLKIFMERLLLKINETDLRDWSKWLNIAKEVHRDYFLPEIIEQINNNKLNPYNFFYKFYQKLDESNYVVTSDGSACVISFQVATIKFGTRLFTNSGFASMGYGLPASIGASFTKSHNKRVFCIEGDGSIQMNLQEIATIKAYNLNIIVIIINNDGYLSIKNTQKNFFGSQFFGVSRSTGLYFPNYEYLAKAYDLKYELITSNEVDYFLENLNNITGPLIVELLVDENVFFQPKNQARIDKDGSIYSSKLDDMFPFLDREEYEAIRMKIRNVK
jgi:acetolactate synthase-1/2/3 large subunit